MKEFAQTYAKVLYVTWYLEIPMFFADALLSCSQTAIFTFKLSVLLKLNSFVQLTRCAGHNDCIDLRRIVEKSVPSELPHSVRAHQPRLGGGLHAVRASVRADRVHRLLRDGRSIRATHPSGLFEPGEFKMSMQTSSIMFSQEHE